MATHISKYHFHARNYNLTLQMIANLDKFVSRKLTEETINAYFGTFNQH